MVVHCINEDLQEIRDKNYTSFWKVGINSLSEKADHKFVPIRLSTSGMHKSARLLGAGPSSALHTKNSHFKVALSWKR